MLTPSTKCVNGGLEIMNSDLNHMISLVVSALVFSGSGFSNFIIFEGHKSPGWALCCLQMASALFRSLSSRNNGAWRHWGKGKGKFTVLSLAYLGDKIFLISLQSKQRLPAEGGFQEWHGGKAGCECSQRGVRWTAHYSTFLRHSHLILTSSPLITH